MSSVAIKDIKSLPAVRLFVLMFSFFVLLLVTAGVTASLDMLGITDQRIKLLTASAVQCILAFCLPAFLTARFSSTQPWGWLGLETSPALMAFVGVIVAYILAIPALNWVVDWNANIHFPEALKGMEETLRGWEEANGAIAETILSGAGVGGIIFAVGIVGLLTGFSEELFFRGALQGIFQRSKMKDAVAVWGAAVIFSALHFQFFGFIPRLLMGAFFGYLFVWSKSLWLPIFAHAFNNSMVVVTFNQVETKAGIESVGLTEGAGFPWIAILSGVVFLFYLGIYKRYLQRKSVGTGNG